MTTTRFSMRKFFSLISTFFLFVFGFVNCKTIVDGMPRIRFANLNTEDKHTATKANEVVTNESTITFLTHGLGGRASDWSNNYSSNMSSKQELSYVKDDDSIIEQMRSFVGGNNFTLYKASYNYYTKQYYYFPEYIDGDNANLEDITGSMHLFKKHTLVVFDIVGTYQAMEDLYNKLHHMIDKILYDYKLSHNASLPRVNLIGHSLGGLLNMQYAIEHPKNVANLISLGTPYNGSWYNNIFIEGLGIKTFKEQPCIAGECEHGYYFCDLVRRRETWNRIYADNRHIRFYAIAGETSIDFWNNLLSSENGIKKFRELSFLKEAFLRIASPFLSGDICVDTESQGAPNFDGAICYKKHFTSSNSNLEKVSENNVPFPHNLEARDTEIINLINSVLFPQNANGPVYFMQNIQIRLLAEMERVCSFILTNKTGQELTFEYGSYMCSVNDARTWNNLEYVETTKKLKNNESTIIDIIDLYNDPNRSFVTISYCFGMTRHILYAEHIDQSSKTLTVYENNIDVEVDDSITKIVDLSVVSSNERLWFIKVTNNMNHATRFFYNKQTQNNISESNYSSVFNCLDYTKVVNVGESAIIAIQKNKNLPYYFFSFFYIEENVRHIIIGDLYQFWDSLSLHTFSIEQVFVANSDNISLNLIGTSFNGDRILELENNSGNAYYFDYNYKMCFFNDGQNWMNLSHVVPGLCIGDGTSFLLHIESNGTADSVAISYISGEKRIILCSNQLSSPDYLSFQNAEIPVSVSIEYLTQIGLLCKSGDKTILELKNLSNDDRDYYYNSYKCFEADATTWSNLKDNKVTKTIKPNESFYLVFTDIGTADSIAISYIKGDTRYIICITSIMSTGAMSLSTSKETIDNTSFNGIKIRNLGKTKENWLIELSNPMQKTIEIEYNQKMCNEGNAKNWMGLSDIKSLKLGPETSSTGIIRIWENVFATHIAISYVEGHYRYVFYADQLNSNGYMNAHSNIIDLNAPPTECVAEGSLITLADGTQKPVEELTGDELLLVWNLETGTYDYAPILFIDSDPIGHYEVINLTFSDNTQVNVISEHGFYDVDINQYVYLDKNAYNYIGHNFKSETGNVTLINVEINTVVTRAYSPVTYGHLCYYVDGMLSMPGGIEGLFNYFDVDSNTMKYDEESKNADIQQYGLFTYEEFNELIPVPEEIFNAVNGQYLKVAIGKGMITLSQIQQLVNRYSVYF